MYCIDVGWCIGILNLYFEESLGFRTCLCSLLAIWMLPIFITHINVNWNENETGGAGLI